MLATACFVFGAFSAPPAGAQASVNVGLGAAVPIGSSADLLNPGYSAMLSFTIRPSWMRNHIRLEGALSSLSEKSAAYSKREFLSGTANLIIIGAPHATPTGYVIIGAGTYQKAWRGGRRTDPGLNAGAGIRFSMGFFGTFVEARLHYVADETKTKYFPMTFGLTF